MKRRISFALAALLALAATSAPAEPRLDRYVPDNANLYFEVQDWKAFLENVKGSPFAAIFETSELKPVMDVIQFEAPSFEGTALEGIFILDTAELQRHMTGAVAVFNTHYGPMSELENSVFNRDGVSATGESMHHDGVLIFEHDGKSKRELLDMFKAAIDKKSPDAKRDREKIGDATVNTARVRLTAEVSEIRFNENAPEDATFEERFQIVAHEIEYENVYQFAVLDDVAFFGEGSNLPVSKALAAIQKKNATLSRSDAWRRSLEAFRADGGGDGGLVGFVRFETFHNAAERGLTPGELETRGAWGHRAFQFAAGRLDLSAGGLTADAYVGFEPGDSGFVSLLRRLKPISRDTFGKLPADAEGATAAGLDLGGLVRDLIALAERSSPELAANRQMMVEQARAFVGVDPLEDLLFLADGEHLMLEDFSGVANWQPGETGSAETWAGAVEVTNGARVAETLATLVEKAPLLIGQDIVETQRFEGMDLHLITIPEVNDGKPVFAIGATGKHLIFSGRAELAKALALSTTQSGGKALSSDRDFRKAWRSVPEGCFVAQFSRDMVLSPEDVSSLGLTALLTLRQYNMLAPETVEKAFETYHEQDYNSEPLRLGTRQISYGLLGRDFARFRATISKNGDK